MKNIPVYNERVALIRAIIDNDLAPWYNKTNWVVVGKTLGITANAASKQYKRLLVVLSKRGINILDFVNHCNLPVLQLSNYGTKLLTEQGFDPDKFELRPRSIWTQGNSQQISYRVVPKTIDEKAVDELVDTLKQHLNVPLKPVIYKDPNDLMAVFSLYDPHFGKLTLNGDDMVETYKDILTDLVYQVVVKEGELGRPVLIIGQDYVNFDTTMGTTSNGTPVESSIDWRELIEVQIAAATWAIDYLTEHFGYVEICHVPGNHDKQSNFWLYKLLIERYKDSPHVQIFGGDDWAMFRHGDVAIMSIHGDVGAHKDYIDLWSNESPITFTAPYKEIHTGHFHTRREVVSEQHGILVRYMPGLCGTDQWHKGKLFLGNNRMGLVTVYDKKHPVAEYYAYVDKNST